MEAIVEASSTVPPILKQILRGTAYELDANEPTPFLNWWETTTWAQAMHHNLQRDPALRESKYSDPKWTSSHRTAKQWTNFGQGAYIRDGKPLVFCLVCKAALQHPRAFNVGTSHLTSHMKSTKCRSKGGQDLQTIQQFLTKVVQISN
jgi:hypothetical protein